MKQAGFWSFDDRLAEISTGGDPLETLSATVDFERFRYWSGGQFDADRGTT